MASGPSGYELPRGRLRFLTVPFASAFMPLSVTAVLLLAANLKWLAIGAAAYLALIEVRACRVRLRADENGIVVVNLIRTKRIEWSDIRGVVVMPFAPQSTPAVQIQLRGPGLRRALGAVSVLATVGMGKRRRHEVALKLAELGRAHGYGFVAGTFAELDEQIRDGLDGNTDPTAHQAWWDAHEPPS